jgi:TolB-like protein/Tfp pilus assembly protein PilF
MEEDVTDELGFIGYLYGRLGRKAEALEQLEALDKLAAKGRYVSPITRSLVYIGLDDKDKAFAYLDEGYQRHSLKMAWLKVWFFYDTLRDDPRFKNLLRRLNFPEAPDSKTGPKPEEAAQAPIEKIAVLPFTSISSESGEEWFVDGMTDALITQLGKIKALTVISRTSAMQYKNVSKPMREIAQDLSVDALIEGSVMHAGNDVLVIARLIDGRTDERVWDEFFQGKFSDILALQSRVTLAIARQIEAALTPEEERSVKRTESLNPDAYEACLKGQFFYWKFTEAGFKSAVEYLEQAIEIDPNYAEAYAWLAFAHWLPSIWGYSRPGESFRNAKSVTNTAIKLDETCVAAHRAAGWIALAYDWDWQKAKESFERARELNPNDPEVYSGLAWYSVVAGRVDEAIEMMRTALKLDPLSLSLNNNLAWMYSFSRQFEQAKEQREKTLELDPDFAAAMDGLAEDYVCMSMYPKAIATLERAIALDGRTPALATSLAGAYALSGMKEEAEIVIRELRKRAASEYVVPTYFAEVYASLGNTDEAFHWLEEAHRERSWGMLFLRHDWYWDPLRSDPRFNDLVQRMKFPE